MSGIISPDGKAFYEPGWEGFLRNGTHVHTVHHKELTKEFWIYRHRIGQPSCWIVGLKNTNGIWYKYDSLPDYAPVTGSSLEGDGRESSVILTDEEYRLYVSGEPAMNDLGEVAP